MKGELSVDLQPVNFQVMSKFENKLVNYTVNSDCSANKLELRVRQVVEDEVIPVETCQPFTSDSARQLEN